MSTTRQITGPGGTVMWDLGGSFPRPLGNTLSNTSDKGSLWRGRQATCPACGLELERVVDADGFGHAVRIAANQHF
jgi:hypothetical protein